MANLTGRPVQTKEAQKAEADRLKAQRSADRGEATKRRVTQTAERSVDKISERYVAKLAEDMAAMGYDRAKVLAFGQEKIGRYSNATVDQFMIWINENRARLMPD